MPRDNANDVVNNQLSDPEQPNWQQRGYQPGSDSAGYNDRSGFPQNAQYGRDIPERSEAFTPTTPDTPHLEFRVSRFHVDYREFSEQPLCFLTASLFP